MIGSGLKKFAQEHSMKVAHGVAYGSFYGFAATMHDGADIKRIFLATGFAIPEQKDQFLAAVNQVDLSRTYRVRLLEVSDQGIQIIFTDNPGTMKKIREFTDWFMPLLQQSGAAPMNICKECGMEIVSGKWVLIEGTAYYLHEGCAQKAARDVAHENVRRKEEDTGSYLKGTVGAFLGALLGSVLWALVLNLGFIASIIGCVIGWLSEKGYTLLKGKRGKGKVVILILAIIFGVVLGCFLADAFSLVGMINSGELPDATYGDIPLLILVMLVTVPEYAAGVLKNLLIGLLFAGLGVFALLRKAGKEAAGMKFVELP